VGETRPEFALKEKGKRNGKKNTSLSKSKKEKGGVTSRGKAGKKKIKKETEFAQEYGGGKIKKNAEKYPRTGS